MKPGIKKAPDNLADFSAFKVAGVLHTSEIYSNPAFSKTNRLRFLLIADNGQNADKVKLPQPNSKLTELKCRLEDYIKSTHYDRELSFGYFLNEYIRSQNKLDKEFAREVCVTQAAISQYLKNRRSPAKWFIIRLELHSNGLIPAVYWVRLIQKEKEQEIMTDSEIRKEESRFVKNSRLPFHRWP